MAKLDISQEEYVKLREAGMSKEEIVKKYSERSLGQKVSNVAKGVTKFVGAEGIAEQFGSSLARTQLKLQGNEEAAQFVKDPSLQKVVGSAIQSGANFIPGIGRGASLLTKVGAGAGTGLAFDVGGNLQAGKEGARAFQPGAGTLVGGSIPVLGKILGYTSKNLPAKLAKRLEDTNLRLTPVERQNLERKGQDIQSYLAQKKIVGTPAKRYAKLNTIYNDFEKQVQNVIKDSGVKYNKKQVLDDLSKIPDAFVDDPELATQAKSIVNRLSAHINKNYGSSIPAETINNLKRNYMKRAFAKNATDVVSDTRLAVGAQFKKMLDDQIELLGPMNREYGLIIASRRALQKALTRPQIGLVGKIAGITAGTAVGGSLGGGAGAAAGAIVGPTVGKTIAGTLPRSAVGASSQIISDIAARIQNLPTDRLGNVSQKAVLNLLQQLKQGQ